VYLREKIRGFFEARSGHVFGANGVEVPPEALRARYRAIRSFVRRNLPPGSRVAIRLPYDVPYLLWIYACMESGVTYIPLQPEWPEHRIDQIRRLAGFDMLVDESNAAPPGVAPEESPGSPEGSALAGERPLYIMFTSGSTGEPKGVVIPRRAYENFLRWMDGYFEAIGPADRMLAVTKFTFDIVGIDIGLLLLRHLTLHFSASAGNAFRLAREIQQFGITCLSTVPNNGMLLMGQDVFRRANLSSMRHLMLGGARFPYALLVRLRENLSSDVAVYNFYGPTEATIYTHVQRLDGSVDDNHRDANVTIGAPISNVSCLVVDAAGNALTEPFAEGQMLLGGVQVMLEYCRNPAKTAQVLEERDGVRYYRTGDRAFFDARGRYYIAGRMDECIKRRGYRIDLLDIDAYILQLPGVKDCLTLAFEDVDAENLLLSVVIPDGGVTEAVLRERMKTVLLDYQIPDRIEFLEVFPLNNAGKVSRPDLMRMFREKVPARPEG
jgi:acyl-CoA synthetase (AMP-forming)/AMP-acid ligase II